MLRSRIRVTSIALVVLVAGLATPRAQAPSNALEPIQYTLRVIDPDKHLAGVEARVPTSGRASIELMMPIWTPGYYVVEDYAARVRDLDGEGGGRLRPGHHEAEAESLVDRDEELAGGDADLHAGGAGTIGDVELGRRGARRDQRRRRVHHARRTCAAAARRAHRDADHLEAIGVRARSAAGRRRQSLPRARLRHPRRFTDRRRRSLHSRVRRGRIDSRHRRRRTAQPVERRARRRSRSRRWSRRSGRSGASCRSSGTCS